MNGRRPQPVTRCPAAPGFTLIELMVVIGLLGILSVMIIPEMRGSMQEAALRSAGREMVDALGLARSQAIATLRIHRVRWVEEENRYLIEGETERDSGSRDSDFAARPELLGAQGALDHRVKLRLRLEPSAEPAPSTPREAQPSDSQSVAFYPDGTADSAEMLLEDRDGFRLVLTVLSATARVKWQDLGRP